MIERFPGIAEKKPLHLAQTERRKRLVSPKIKFRLFGLFLLCSLLAVLYIYSFLDERAEKAVIAHYQDSINSSFALNADDVTDLFLELQRGTTIMAESSPVRHAEAIRDDARALHQLLAPIGTLHQVVDNAHLVWDDGSITSYGDQPEWTPKQIRIEPLELKGEDTLWLAYDIAPSDLPSIFISQRVVNESGKAFATLLTEINLPLLSTFLSLGPTEQNKQQMLVTPAGKIIYHTDETLLGKQVEQIPEYREMMRNFNHRDAAGISSFVQGDTEMIAFQYVSPQNGYIFYNLTPGAVVKADLLSLRLLMIAIPVIVFSVAGYVYFQFVRFQKGRNGSAGRVGESSQSADSPQNTLIPEGLEAIVRSFYLAVEMKDRYTAGHTERVTQYALAIYDQMDEEQKRLLPRDDLRYAGLLHDIGKVAVPDHILLKEGRLTEAEYELIKRHPTVGADLVEQIEYLAHVSPGVRYHHERWDGKGYPAQLKEEEIPLIGRILAVADTFDAMTSARTYRKALPAQVAFEEILRCAGTQFDPNVVAVFAMAYQNGAITRHQEREIG